MSTMALHSYISMDMNTDMHVHTYTETHTHRREKEMLHFCVRSGRNLSMQTQEDI